MTSFGEIVEPVSRSTFEDWDEISSDNTSNISGPELKWQDNILVSPEHIDMLLIFEGKYLSDSIKMEADNNLTLINTVPEVNMNLYKADNTNTYVCTIKDYNLLISSEIVELLKTYITTTNDVIAIQTKSLPNYQVTELSTQDCVIRSVSTTNTVEWLFNFPQLEQPNMLSGVSAGAISLREHMNRSGTAIVCYIEHSEEHHIKELEQLLKTLNIVQQVGPRPSSILNSNLYL